jgi:hypothetical protein
MCRSDCEERQLIWRDCVSSLEVEGRAAFDDATEVLVRLLGLRVRVNASGFRVRVRLIRVRVRVRIRVRVRVRVRIRGAITVRVKGSRVREHTSLPS